MSTVTGISRTGLGTLALEAPSTQPEAAEAQSSLLPDPVSALTMSGDPGAMLAALVIGTAKDETDVARQLEQDDNAVQDHEEDAQVAAMREKASETRSGAIESGLAGAVGGGLTLAGACFPDKSDLARRLDGASKVASPLHDVVSQWSAAATEETEANATMHEHNASHASRASSQTYDQERDAKKLLDTAIDFYREYSDAKDQSDAAASHHS